jgi:hypothetical protein
LAVISPLAPHLGQYTKYGYFFFGFGVGGLDSGFGISGLGVGIVEILTL